MTRIIEFIFSLIYYIIVILLLCYIVAAIYPVIFFSVYITLFASNSLTWLWLLLILSAGCCMAAYDVFYEAKNEYSE